MTNLLVVGVDVHRKNNVVSLMNQQGQPVNKGFRVDWPSLSKMNGSKFQTNIGEERPLELAHPYAAWERGSNENMNGLVRQYVPKQRDLSTVSDEELIQIMNKLNHRPRKCLDFRTPFEVFFDQPVALTS